ncbi:hypothetical protein LTR56_012836 [Elasticomyces elasticus]|nr:hypothetical protein LTR56_012836 [Elasticomyces elasticus]KAK3647121.1 hypothetical protein LTR22_013914 [Elasticomyces elasticus]KAK4918557.1 hypothetical protein LTR49_013627 [Elasticomyces elasticus]KAK5756078.1 hypothetical protein LTS12_013761 [Elasticomyces elasticus]
MRVRSISATALAAFAAFQPLAFAVAQQQAHPIDTDSVQSPHDIIQEGAIAYNSSATTTHTLTRTVMRVVQTEYATRNVSTATPSLTMTPYYNGTASAFGSGVAGASATGVQSAKPMVPTGGAAQRGLDVVGMAAVVGMVGVFLV